MSIYKTNRNLPDADRIDQINDMVIELYGSVSQGKFDINEITQIYTDLTLDREFKRNISLGNSLTTYGNWTHLKAEDGYSIWKLTPNDYAYDALNNVYLDDKVLENRGEADSEIATAFDFVYSYDAEAGSGVDPYIDNTAEASTEEGTEFDVMDTTDDYLYLGESNTFSAAKFEWHTRGSYYNLVVEYWNGAWTTLTGDLNDLVDDTSNFESDGRISWTIPGDWATTSVNSQTKYWIRISTVQTPVNTAKCYYLIPGDSVVAKLSLSSTQIQEEDWAWCTYGSTVYVTIRNQGNAAYEGDYYITSSSTVSNKQNYFIYNHIYKSDYRDSTYVPGGGAGVAGYYQAPVITKVETSPPSGQSDGDRYLIINADSGDWYGHEGDIAEWYDLDSSWHFTNPLQGMITWVKDEDAFYVYYNAQWNLLSTGGGGLTWQAPVITTLLNAAPGSPSDGERYVIAAGVVSGDAWYGEVNNIAEYDTGIGWIFTTAVEGMAVYSTDEDEFYLFDGTDWQHWGRVLDFISDKDGDTKVETERTADGDTIYLRTAGVDRAEISPTGEITFYDIPTGPSALPTTDYELANKKYVDDAVALEDIWDRSSGGIITTKNSGDDLQLGSGAIIDEFSIDGTLSADSDTLVPTQKAVKTYVDNATGLWERNSSGYLYPDTDGDGVRVYNSGGTEYLEISDTGIDSSTLIQFYGLYTFPDSLGASGQILKLDSGGSLYWSDDTGGGGSGASYTRSFTDGDLDSSNIMVVSHALGVTYPHVVLYDENEEIVLASVEYIDTNTITIDLDPVAPISGTWNVRVSGGAGGGSGTPGGSDTQIQFNDSGSFGGDADFTWDKSSNTLTINGYSFPTSTGTPGQVLVLQTGNTIDWEDQSGGGSTTLAALTDVNIPSPSDGEVLTYDNGTSKWIAGAAAGATTYYNTFDDGDLDSSGILAINHGLGENFPHVIIFDENSQQVQADNIENIDSDNIEVELSTFAPLTGTWKIRVSAGAGSGTGSATDPGGLNTQIQFNDAGVFNGDADLTWNKTTNLLTINGDISLDDITATGNIGVVDVNASGDVTAVGDLLGVNLELDSAGAVYEGDPTVDGTWRMWRSGTDLLFQRRESSVWVTKGTFLA